MVYAGLVRVFIKVIGRVVTEPFFSNKAGTYVSQTPRFLTNLKSGELSWMGEELGEIRLRHDTKSSSRSISVETV